MRWSFVFAFLFLTIAHAQAEIAIKSPGQMIQLDKGRALHVLCKGKGEPTTIIDAGHASWSIYWMDVQEAAAKLTRICLFDRPGYGWSDSGTFPRDISANAKDLNAALSASGEVGPYVIAGHSYGGLAAMAYTQAYPKDVFALLLIDSAHPEQSTRLPAELISQLNASIIQWWKISALAALGIAEPQVQNHPHLPEERQAWARWSLSQARSYAAMASELEQFDASIDILQKNRKALRNKPLLVLTANKSFDWFSQGDNTPAFQEAAKTWITLQKEFLALSDLSVQQFSDGNHALQISDPASVVRAIRGLAQLYRGEVTKIGDLSDTD